MVWRYILAFVLSLAVIWGWNIFFPPQKPPRVEPVPGARPAVRQPDSGPAEKRDAERHEPDREPPPEPVVSDRPQRPHEELRLAVSRAQLHAEGKPDELRFSIGADSLGGRITTVSLPEFRDKEDREKPYQLLDTVESADRKTGGLLRIEISHQQSPWQNSIPWEEWELEPADGQGAPGVRFKNEFDGLTVTKTLSCPAPRIPAAKTQPKKLPKSGLYHLVVSVEFKNESDEPKTFFYRLFGPEGIDTAATRGAPGTDIYFVSGRWVPRGKTISPQVVQAVDLSNGDVSSELAWVGVSNNYFASLIFPYGDEPGPTDHIAGGFADQYPDPGREQELADAGEDVSKSYKNVYTRLDSRQLTLAPGESVVHRYGLFMGPRSKEVVATYSPLSFDSVNDYNFLVSFFLALLGFLKDVSFGSWGMAIVLMTVLVKVCLHPFNRKSQGNMHRFQKQMQKVKPEMDEIKQRYKDNRLKQNQEMQRLFKEKGINPGQQMGGCLLILVQLPIWFALYRTLGYSLGLRQASFLWIDDLTMPDRLFRLDFGAFGGMFMYFNILPVLYVIFTIVNQRLQPKPEDPQMRSQYQMMTFMMVFFGFIFYNFPAGFMLYIMTSTFIGIFESKMIKAELAREEAAATGAVPAGGVQVAAAGGAMYGGKGGGGGTGGRRGGGGGGKRRGKGAKGARGKGKR